MLNQLFPRSFDNSYRGHRVGLWLFALLVVMKTIISMNSIINGDVVASSADGIPLDTYPSAAAQTIVALFGLLGLSRLMTALLSIVVLIRYRSMVPLLFVLLLVEHLGGKLILRWSPIVRTGTPPAPVIHLVLLTLMIAGLVLSLLPAASRASQHAR